MLVLTAARIDLDAGTVTRDGHTEPLLAMEAALLRFLAANPERSLPRDELLVEVWGYRPGVRTRTLDTTVKTLRNRIEADPSRPDHVRTVRGVGYCFVPAAPTGVVEAPLPSPTDRFFGRETEQAAIAAALSAGDRLVTLLGPGGIGKTRLAIASAADHPSAVFCDLGPARTATDLLAELARALRVSRTDADRLGRVLDGRGGALLILDNAEGLDEPATTAVGGLLAAAPRLRILATSRRPLRVRGERRIEVPSLDRADAVALLVDRGRRVRASFGGPSDQPALARIVDALDGIPLALELAAARAAVLTADALATRLEGSLGWLDRGPADVPDRHRTLSAAIAWTWDLLTDGLRDALSQCAVFVGSFTPDAADAVLRPGDGLRPLDALQALREWSLLADRDVPELGQVRLRLLEAVRTFVLETRPPTPDVRDRHVAWAVTMGEALTAAADQHDGPRSVARLVAERENLLSALQNGSPEQVVRVARVLDRALVHLGLFRERVRVHDRAVAVAPTPALLAHALRFRADARFDAGVPGVDEDLDQALLAAREADDPAVDARVLATITMVRVQQSRLAEAAAVGQQALALHRALGDERAEADRLSNLGQVHAHSGRRDDAFEAFGAALALHRKLGNQTNAGKILGFLGALHEERGELDEAARCFTRALQSHREVGYAPGVLRMQGNLGLVAANRGAFAEAAGAFRAVVAEAVRTGDLEVERIGRTYGSRMALYLGRTDDAIEEAALAVALFAPGSSPLFEALALAASGTAQRVAGRTAVALRTLDRAVERIQEAGDPRLGAHVRLERAMARAAVDPAAADDDVQHAATVLGDLDDPPGQQVLALVRAWCLLCADPPCRDEARAERDRVGPPASDHVHWLVTVVDRRIR